MAILSGTVSGNSQPDNVSSGDFTWTVNTGDYLCGNTVQPIVLDDSLGMTPGRYVVIRVLKSAGSITGYAGATVTPPTGLAVYAVSRENVNYSGVTYDCIVVTLVAA
jgi:hypothetical protein